MQIISRMSEGSDNSAESCFADVMNAINMVLAFLACTSAYSFASSSRPVVPSRAHVVAVTSWYDAGQRLGGGTVPSTDPKSVPLDEERWGGVCRAPTRLAACSPLLLAAPSPLLLYAIRPLTGAAISFLCAEPPPASKSGAIPDVNPAMIGAAVLAVGAGAFFFTQQS